MDNTTAYTEQQQNTTTPIVKVDLTNCDKEPIHIPGRIQSHGYLVAFDVKERVICYTSDNIRFLSGNNPKNLIGQPVTEFINEAGFGEGKIDYLQLIEYAEQNDFENINPIIIEQAGRNFYMIVHRSGNMIAMEFEPADPSIDRGLQRFMGMSLAKILEARTIQKTLDFAAKQIKELIGYDRVMIYKFWEDGHGEVMAEEKNDDLEPFLGLHYPASDIPVQARALYKLNLVRIIANVNADPNALISHAVLHDQPLDLTHSTLRAVSPIHIEYLKNMGVQASFSVSIVINDQLWGLIACHNYTPRFIDYKARNSAKLIGQVLSSSLEFRVEEQQKELMRKFQADLHTITRIASKDWDIANALVKYDTTILNLTSAPGAALLFEDKIYLLGITPTEEEVRGIERWYREHIRSTMYRTDSLMKEYAPAAAFKNTASGLLCCTLSRELRECIMWFKPELLKTVNWAGNPEKTMTVDSNGQTVLSPRRSFDLWSQQVDGTSEPWSSAEIGSAMKIREEIVQLINHKANQIRILNEKLQKAYDELDTFSFTISHDLKTPLASIRNYTEILLEDFPEFNADVKTTLSRIVRSTDRMNLLIKEVLAYSRIGRKEIETAHLDMNKLITQCKIENLAAYPVDNVKFIVKNTPSIDGDGIMISQVFNNLIGNALKYSSKNPTPKITVNGEETDNEVIYTIEDNGIGIDMQYGNQIFDLFKRLESAKSFDGSGVGLAIVKRIVEKHQGKIWYESELGIGTKFYLSFNKK